MKSTSLLIFLCLLYSRNASAEELIVGGADAAVNAAPFMVSIQQNGVQYCAGCILTANWVVTAAHCLSSKDAVMAYQLVAGTNNIINPASTAQYTKVASYKVHPKYTGGTVPYDIGIILTNKPFQWTVAVKSIPIAVPNSVISGSATVFGWGKTTSNANDPFPKNLQEVTVPILSLDSCRAALAPNGNLVDSTNICTGPLTGGISICNADSGGPLVKKSKNGIDVLVGIVFWGRRPCGSVNGPSIYTDVAKMNTGIRSNAT